MGEQVFVSICIPAYKRISHLHRLLDSIENQTYRHFEVVITDDSPDGELSELCRTHPVASAIRYYKNERPLGTPENWNESIRRAKGNWIKIMHDDDWFAYPGALEAFTGAISKYPGSQFFFSAYTNVYLDKNTRSPVQISRGNLQRLEHNPKVLLSQNVIGPPSVTFHRSNPAIRYDREFKWLVDIDYYIRFIETTRPVFLPDNLIMVGMGGEQVTEQVFRNAAVEIPENIRFLNKIGLNSLMSWRVYDGFWRFIRNLNIRKTEQLKDYGFDGNVPEILRSMIAFQSAVPPSLLKTGAVSKILMFTHYLSQYPKLNRG